MQILLEVFTSLRDDLNVATNRDVATDNSSYFKYKSSLLGAPTAAGVLSGVKIVAPLKYLTKFFRSL